jgi:hypothetical protein
MLRQIGTRQFQEWRDYFELEPFDEGREDLRNAAIVQQLVIGRLGPRSRKPKLDECVLRFGDATPPPAPTQTPEQARAQILMTLRAMVASQPKKKRRA